MPTKDQLTKAIAKAKTARKNMGSLLVAFKGIASEQTVTDLIVSREKILWEIEAMEKMLHETKREE